MKRQSVYHDGGVLTSIDVENATIEIEAMQEHNRECFLKIIELTKQRDEAIAELEALQQRSCESCRHWDFNEQGHFKKCFNGKGNVSSTKGDFCCNRYEAKEQWDELE